MTIAVTDKHREALRNHAARTGLEPYAFWERAQRRLGDIWWYRIDGWMTGEIGEAHEHEIDRVLHVWASLPSLRAPLTTELLEQIRELRRRTGVGPQALFSKAPQRPPDGLYADNVNAWLSGGIRNARPDHIAYVLQTWESIPPRVPLAPVRGELIHHRDRTGVSPQALLKGTQGRPRGLTSCKVAMWLTGPTKSAFQDELDFVLNHWRDLPPRDATRLSASHPD